MAFDQQAFNQFVIENDIIGFFAQPIKLVSGRTSFWYVNWRNAMYDAFLLDTVSDFFLAFIQDKNISGDCFYGVPDGTTKLAVLSQYKFVKSKPDFAPGKYVFTMARKTPKDHGDPKDRFFVGQPKGDVIVIEDVTTTGESLLKHVRTIQDFGVTVTCAITLTNRNEIRDNGKSIEQELKEINVPYFAMSHALELLPLAIQKKNPTQAIKDSIVKEFETHGERKITL